MKITLVSSGSGSRGGGEIYLAFLAQGLADLGHQVTALVPAAEKMDGLSEMLTPWATVQRFAFRATYERRLRTLGAWLDRDQQRDLAARFSALETDVLHVNQQVAEDGLDLVMAAAESGQPWLSTVHVGRSARDLGAVAGGLRDSLTARVMRRAAGDHIAVSAASRDQLAGWIGEQGEGAGGPRLHVVRNGVPQPDPAELATARIQARQDWAVQDGEIVVGMVGRIEAQKDPLALVRHLAPLSSQGVSLRLVWIGDGSLRRALENDALLQTPPVPLVIDGWRSDAALRLAGLDLFIMPSRFEGLPLALLEAMHAGLPVVVSRTDGMSEAVNDGENGLVCEDDAGWQVALTRLLENPALRKTMGQAACIAAQERFSTESMARATLEVYRNVLGPSADEAPRNL